MMTVETEALTLAKSAATYVSKVLHGKMTEDENGSFEVTTAKGNRVVITAQTVNTSTVEMFKLNKGRIKAFEVNALDYLLKPIDPKDWQTQYRNYKPKFN